MSTAYIDEEKIRRFETYQSRRRTDDQGHEEPIPPPPTWPEGVFPSSIENYISASAKSLPVPVEMVAVPLLVFAGGTIGNAVQLQLKPGWSILPALWAGLINDPGRKKTPSLLAAQWPLNVLQKQLHDEHQRAMADHERDLEAWESRPKDQRGPKPIAPQMDHLFTTNTTLEKMVDMLNKCRGVSIIYDELSGFIGGMNQYRGGKGNDRQQYLSLWAGAPIKADRMSGGTAYTTHPVGSVYGGIQTDFANDLHNKNGHRDGMVERFLLYRPEVRRSGWTDEAVDPALLDPVVDVFASLRSIKRRTIDEVGSGEERLTVKMHPDARKAFIDWYNANDAAVDQASGLRAGFYSKLDSQVARLALILHCMHNPLDPRLMLAEATMLAAIEIAEFFRSHLDRVLPLIGDTSEGSMVGLPARIVRYLRMPDLQEEGGWVPRSALYSRLRNVSAQKLTDELRELDRDGIVEVRQVETGTKPGEQWRIRPREGTHNSEYSQNSSPNGSSPEETANSRNCANGQGPDITTGNEVWDEMADWSAS